MAVGYWLWDVFCFKIMDIIQGRVPLAGSIRLILPIRAMERDVPADRIGSSGTSQNGDPNRSNMADALATYWRRVSIPITAAVSNCVAKMTHFVMNLTSFYRIQLHSYDFILSFKSTDIPDWQQSAFIFYISWQKQIGSLYYLAGSDRSVPLQHQDRSGTFLPMERGPVVDWVWGQQMICWPWRWTVARGLRPLATVHLQGQQIICCPKTQTATVLLYPIFLNYV